MNALDLVSQNSIKILSRSVRTRTWSSRGKIPRAISSVIRVSVLQKTSGKTESNRSRMQGLGPPGTRDLSGRIDAE